MNGESDEANNVNVLQKKIQKVVEEQEKMKEEFTSAMKKTRDDVSLLADKLDQLIEKVNLLPIWNMFEEHTQTLPIPILHSQVVASAPSSCCHKRGGSIME